MSLIEVKDIYYSYDESHNAINGVTFNIEQGNYVTVIGHNGSGKSTLAKLLAGLLEIKKGEIKIDNLTLNLENLPKIREMLDIVFQNPDNQFIGSTVRDDIAFGLENHLVPTEEMDGIINEFAKQVGVLHLLDKEPQNLSGGQKQRVAIAGVLAMKPRIIIFDEATSMLDPKGKKEIKRLIRELNNDERFTIISITHDIEEVLQSDDCIVLNKGKIFLHDHPSKVFEDREKLLAIGLDVPFASQVKEEFKKQGIKLKANGIDEIAEELWQLNSKN